MVMDPTISSFIRIRVISEFQISHFQNKAKCKTFLVKMSFIWWEQKIIFKSMASHFASLWNRVLAQLRNGLFLSCCSTRAGILYLCPCLVPRPHYSARPMRFRSRGPSEEVSFLPVFLGYVTEVNWPRRPGKTPGTKQPLSFLDQSQCNWLQLKHHYYIMINSLTCCYALAYCSVSFNSKC